jgi:hypothetical protein
LPKEAVDALLRLLEGRGSVLLDLDPPDDAQ